MKFYKTQSRLFLKKKGLIPTQRTWMSIDDVIFSEEKSSICFQFSFLEKTCPSLLTMIHAKSQYHVNFLPDEKFFIFFCLKKGARPPLSSLPFETGKKVFKLNYSHEEKKFYFMFKNGKCFFSEIPFATNAIAALLRGYFGYKQIW